MEVSQLHDLDAEFDKLISITEHELSKTINATELVKGRATATIATYVPSVEKPPPNIALPIPPPISPYLSLTFLDVSNTTDNFPEWLPECINLTHLIAANHHLTAIPSFVTEKLTKLQVIDLSWNQLNEWPMQFAKLPDLKVLNLEGNPFFVRLIENNPRFWIEYSKSTSSENINGNDVARTHTNHINPIMSKKPIISESKKRQAGFRDGKAWLSGNIKNRIRNLMKRKAYLHHSIPSALSLAQQLIRFLRHQLHLLTLSPSTKCPRSCSTRAAF